HIKRILDVQASILGQANQNHLSKKFISWPSVYILIEANNNILSVVLDISADNSIINRYLKSGLDVQFEDNIIVSVEFLIIDKGAVPIMLDLNVFQRPYCNVDYKNEMINIEVGINTYSTQMFSKEILIEIKEILFQESDVCDLEDQAIKISRSIKWKYLLNLIENAYTCNANLGRYSTEEKETIKINRMLGNNIIKTSKSL
ncbi:hypothetical protein BB561_006432, partial [Smittium simulii]